MKQLKKIPLLFLLFFIAQMSYAHEPVDYAKSRKVEEFWVNNGTPSYFRKLKDREKLNERQLALFAGKHVSAFSVNKRAFFRQINLEGDLDKQLNASLVWLREREQDYDSMFAEFEISPEEETFSATSSSSVLSAVTDCNNVGFSAGNTNNWTLSAGVSSASGNHNFVQDIYSNLYTAGKTLLINSGFDENVPVLPKTSAPGNYSLRLENIINGGHAFQAEYEFVAEASQRYFMYKYAVVLEEPESPPHPDAAKPFFSVKIYAKTTGPTPVYQEIECARYHVVANSSTPELQNNFIKAHPDATIYYKPWTTVVVPLDNYIGQDIKVVFTTSDCAWAGHLGYAYIDASCMNPYFTPGPCLPDGTRKLAAPEGFSKYWWQGVGIAGSNAVREISVKKGGTYKVMLMTENNGCPATRDTTIDGCPPPSTPICSLTNINATPQSCNSSNGTYSLNLSLSFTNAPTKGVLMITVGPATYTFEAPFTSPFNYTLNNLYADGKTYQVTATFYQDRFISPAAAQCSTTVSFTAPTPCAAVSIGCPDCISGFKPEVGKTYVISAWVKDAMALPDVTDLTDPYIQISFTGSSTTYGPLKGSGKIIDGWQRVYAEFTIPSGATDITITLGTATHQVHFDDIRVHPKDASYASYVYDPVSLKLVATLDNNNYATFYEYDNEGALIRVKKETERGIMTIQENRNNQPKR